MSCDCNVSLSNSGSGCTPILEEARQYVFVPTFKEDGTKNFIDLSTAALDTAYWTTQLNAVSAERWRPSLTMNLVTDGRGDSITQDLGGGRIAFLAEGTRNAIGTMVGKLANPQLLGKLKAYGCQEMSAYVIANDGGLLGTELGGDSTKLYPIRIENETFEAKFVKHSINGTTQQGIEVKWTWSLEENDEDLRQITEGEMTNPVAGIKGLVDVNGVVSAEALTSFVIALTNDYGTPINPGLIKGLVSGDFTLEELTPTPAAIPILTAAESPDGSYTITYAAQTSADKLKLTPSKDGLDFTAIEAIVITLP